MSVGFLPSVVDLNIIQASVNRFRSALCCLTSVKQWNLFQIVMGGCYTVCLQQFFTLIGSLKYRIGKRGNFLFLPKKAEQCNKFVLVFMLHMAIRNNRMKFSRGCKGTSPKLIHQGEQLQTVYLSNIWEICLGNTLCWVLVDSVTFMLNFTYKSFWKEVENREKIYYAIGGFIFHEKLAASIMSKQR